MVVMMMMMMMMMVMMVIFKMKMIKVKHHDWPGGDADESSANV